MQMTAIQFTDVSYQVNDQKIISHITGSFQKGKITALVGPSGAGKTTLLKLCNGLISPTSGAIEINGEKSTQIAPTILRRTVGIALQDAPIIKGSVYENLSLPLTLQQKTLRKQKAIELLEEVGLNQNLLNQNAAELSGGQRQKLSLARTLVNASSILLLDEITSSLDVHSTKEIEQLIQSINEKYGTTIIWITHNLEQAKKVGHDAWLLKDGAVVETGSIDLLNTSENPITQQFIKGELA